MEVVDVLGDKCELFEPVFPFSKGAMSRIRLDACEHSSSVVEPLPHKLGIGSDQLGRGKFGDGSTSPGPDLRVTPTAKSGHSTLSGNARAGEHRDTPCAVECGD